MCEFTTTITFGSTTLTNNGDRDGFLTKLDSTGKVLWAVTDYQGKAATMDAAQIKLTSSPIFLE